MGGNSVKTADFIIVGAGVMGASIAFSLAKRKVGRIVVLEKEHIGRGGSGRSSALIRMHYSFPPEVRLAVKSLEIFQNWKEIVGEPGGFRKIGFARLVPNNELHLLKANVAMLQECGANTRLISLAELREMEPDWNLEDEPAAAYEPDGGYGDGAIAALDLMSAARERGVDYRPRTQVIGMLLNGSGIHGVVTAEGIFEAPIVVLATGPWTRPLLRPIGVDLPIDTEFHQVAILRNPPELKASGSACIDSCNTVYFRSDAHDKTLLGDFYGQRGLDADNFPQRTSDDWLEKILEQACHRIPKLQNAEVMRGITGIYDMSPDSRPLLGEVSQVPRLYVAAGFSGMGFKISPAVGLVMAELILDGAGKTVDISAFRPSRFEEGQPIKAEFEYQDD